MNEYLRGNVVTISASFSISGVAINPTAVLVEVQRGETKTRFVYGVDPEVKLLVTGTYYMDVVADPVGLYTYLWYSTGTGQAAYQDNFIVTDSIGN